MEQQQREQPARRLPQQEQSSQREQQQRVPLRPTLLDARSEPKCSPFTDALAGLEQERRPFPPSQAGE